MLTVGISVGLYRWLRRRRKKQASESWAATTGRVESSEVPRARAPGGAPREYGRWRERECRALRAPCDFAPFNDLPA